MALILGGGQGRRLCPVTRLRAKPAVVRGGTYRLSDTPISDCLDSGIYEICILTQFLSASPHCHIRQTYRFDVFSGGSVCILAAAETPTRMDWPEGTADAVRKQLPRFAHSRVEDLLILSGDHLSRVDYAFFRHLDSFDFYGPNNPVCSRLRFLPPSRTDGCRLGQTVQAKGCLIAESDIRDSVPGLRRTVGPGTRVTRTVTVEPHPCDPPERKAETRRRGRPNVGIGCGSSIEGAIIDRNARIGEEVVIRPHGPVRRR